MTVRLFCRLSQSCCGLCGSWTLLIVVVAIAGNMMTTSLVWATHLYQPRLEALRYAVLGVDSVSEHHRAAVHC